MIAAVQDGLRKAPNALLPSTIYLVAHFTRADVPSFSDFKDEATRSALQLDNIRNLFMNVANDIRLDLGDTGFGSKQLGQAVSSGCIGFLQVLHLAISSNPLQPLLHFVKI